MNIGTMFIINSICKLYTYIHVCMLPIIINSRLKLNDRTIAMSAVVHRLKKSDKHSRRVSRRYRSLRIR